MIKKSVVTTYSNEEGFDFTFEPIEESLTIEKTKDGYTAKYLTQDTDPQNPDEYDDGGLFLVGYHSDFTVDRSTRKDGKRVGGISQELAQCINRGGKYEDGSVCEEAKEYCKKYHIFLLDAYIHSGVSLSLHSEGVQCRWDTSVLGLCFASKKEWRTRKAGEKAVRGLIKEWNQYRSGDVYCIVKEEYNEEKESVNYDVRGGFGGYEYAVESLKTEI